MLTRANTVFRRWSNANHTLGYLVLSTDGFYTLSHEAVRMERRGNMSVLSQHGCACIVCIVWWPWQERCAGRPHRVLLQNELEFRVNGVTSKSKATWRCAAWAPDEAV